MPWMSSVDIPMCCFPTELSTTACTVPASSWHALKRQVDRLHMQKLCLPPQRSNTNEVPAVFGSTSCATVSMAGQTLGSTTPCLPRIVHSGLRGALECGDHSSL